MVLYLKGYFKFIIQKRNYFIDSLEEKTAIVKMRKKVPVKTYSNNHQILVQTWHRQIHPSLRSTPKMSAGCSCISPKWKVHTQHAITHTHRASKNILFPNMVMSEKGNLISETLSMPYQFKGLHGLYSMVVSKCTSCKYSTVYECSYTRANTQYDLLVQ